MKENFKDPINEVSSENETLSNTKENPRITGLKEQISKLETIPGFDRTAMDRVGLQKLQEELDIELKKQEEASLENLPIPEEKLKKWAGFETANEKIDREAKERTEKQEIEEKPKIIESEEQINKPEEIFADGSDGKKTEPEIPKEEQIELKSEKSEENESKKNGTFINPDDGSREDYDDGKLQYKEYPDGTREVYNDNGKIITKFLSDGGTENYIDGKIFCKEYPDGRREWFNTKEQMEEKINTSNDTETNELISEAFKEEFGGGEPKPAQVIDTEKEKSHELKEEIEKKTKRGFFSSLFGGKKKEEKENNKTETGQDKKIETEEKLEENEPKEFSPEEKLIGEKRSAYVKAYNEWKKASKGEKENKAKEADVLYKEYKNENISIAKAEYGKKKAELESSGKNEEEIKGELKKFQAEEIFSKYILGEEEILSKAKVESWPPKEKGIFRKGLEKWNKLPKPARWAISASIATGIAVGGGAFVGITGAASYFGLRITRSMASGIATISTDAVLTGLFKTIDRFTKREEKYSKKIETIIGSDDFLNHLDQKLEEINEIRKEKARFEKYRNIGKLVASVGAGVFVGIEGSHLQAKLDNITGVHSDGVPADTVTQAKAEVVAEQVPADSTLNVLREKFPFFAQDKTFRIDSSGVIIREGYSGTYTIDKSTGDLIYSGGIQLDDSSKILPHILKAGSVTEQWVEAPLGTGIKPEQLEQLELATVGKGEGIERVLQRQLLDNPQKWGFKGDVTDKIALREWAGGKAHIIAIDQGYVNPKTGLETRVLDLGPSGSKGNLAYILEQGSEGKLSVREYLEGKPTGGENVVSSYEYGWQKPAVGTHIVDNLEPKGMDVSPIDASQIPVSVKITPFGEAVGFINTNEHLIQEAGKSINDNFDHIKHMNLSDQQKFFEDSGALNKNLYMYEDSLQKMRNAGLEKVGMENISDKMNIVKGIRDKMADLQEFHEKFRNGYENIITQKAGLSISDYTKEILNVSAGKELHVVDIVHDLNIGALKPNLEPLGNFIFDKIDPYNIKEQYAMTVDEFIQKVAQEQAE